MLVWAGDCSYFSLRDGRYTTRGVWGDGDTQGMDGWMDGRMLAYLDGFFLAAALNCCIGSVGGFGVCSGDLGACVVVLVYVVEYSVWSTWFYVVLRALRTGLWTGYVLQEP